jgi:hypothetical protein
MYSLSAICDASQLYPANVSQPQRALTYIKSHHATLLVPTFLTLFSAMWLAGHDISSPDLLEQALRIHFSTDEAAAIMKGQINKNTNKPCRPRHRRRSSAARLSVRGFGLREGMVLGNPFSEVIGTLPLLNGLSEANVT